MKSCPFCAEQIQDAAIKCRYCGSDLVTASSDTQVGAKGLTEPSLRSCPFCSSEIPATATICPSCGDDVSYGATTASTPEKAPAPSESRSQKVSPKGIVIAVVVLGVLYLIGAISSSDAPSSKPSSTASREVTAPPTTAPSTTARPVLELQAWNWHKTYDYVEVEGQVKNISGASLENVAVVALFYDKDGGFITSDSALIDYNPILSGQVSPFKVMERWNPAMKNAQIEFKELLGKKLEHISVSK